LKEPKKVSGNTSFAMRDDDVSYFTNASMLETLYDHAWKLSFKASLAVIPNRGMHGKNFLISENKELVKYLKNKIDEGVVDIILHGYAHTRIADKHEFAINNFQQVDKTLMRGRKILEETFKCQVSVFTAPHDAVSRATMKSMEKNKMCLCRRFTLGRLLSVLPTKSLKSADLIKTAVRSVNPRRVMPNTIIRISSTPIIQWNAYFSPMLCISHQVERTEKLFMQKKRQKEPFVLLHHHWEYFTDTTGDSVKTDRLDLFNSFLDFVSKENVQKISLSDMCECLIEGC